MAGFFTGDEIALLSASTVRVATLVKLEFASETRRLFAGAGIRDFGGEAWEGLGGMIQIDGLADQRGTADNTVTFTLSGVDGKALPKALSEAEEVINRPATVLWQLLDRDHQPVGRLIPMWFGLMQQPMVDRTEAAEGGGALCTVTLPCRSLMSGRARPPRGRYTDRDQQARSPGDRYFDRIFETKGKVIVWPDFD